MTTLATPTRQEKTNEAKITWKDVLIIGGWYTISTLLMALVLYFWADWSWRGALLVPGLVFGIVSGGLFSCSGGEPEPAEREIDSYSRKELRAMSLTATREAEEFSHWGNHKAAAAQSALALTYATLAAGTDKKS